MSKNLSLDLVHSNLDFIISVLCYHLLGTVLSLDRSQPALLCLCCVQEEEAAKAGIARVLVWSIYLQDLLIVLS